MIEASAAPFMAAVPSEDEGCITLTANRQEDVLSFRNGTPWRPTYCNYFYFRGSPNMTYQNKVFCLLIITIVTIETRKTNRNYL